ncbi:MAG: hypothetical protein R3B49_04245 [Phycisphaerales bacterium]
MPESIAAFFTPQLLVSIGVLAIVANVVLLSGGVLDAWSGKISAYIEDRIGPNRAGFDFRAGVAEVPEPRRVYEKAQ